MNYQESISRLEEASVFGIKPGLERMQKFLMYWEILKKPVR